MSNVLTKPEFHVFVAVRMKSSRLPFKAMLDVYGKSMLLRLVERLAEKIPKGNIVICTSINAQDDEIERFSNLHQLNVYRGDELDVMDRFINAAIKFNAKTIVRVTGDNPLTDPSVLKKMVDYHKYMQSEYTFTKNIPVGVRAEIIDISALNRIHKQLKNPMDSEYMTLMLNRPDKLKVVEYREKDLSIQRPELSLTVDTNEDIELIRGIYENFKGTLPDLGGIIEWLDANPDKKITFNTSKLPGSINCSFIGDVNNG